MCCDLVLVPPQQYYRNKNRAPQLLWAVGKSSPPVFRAVRHGVICVFSKQRGQDWEGKEKLRNCLTNPNEHFWCWQIQIPGVSRARVFTVQCFGFSTSPDPTSPLKQHPEKKLLYSHLMGSVQNITPWFWKAHEAIQYPPLSITHLRMYHAGSADNGVTSLGRWLYLLLWWSVFTGGCQITWIRSIVREQKLEAGTAQVSSGADGSHHSSHVQHFAEALTNRDEFRARRDSLH